MTRSPTLEVVHGGLMQAAEAEPDRVALYDGGQSFTYADLVSRCRRIAGEIDRRQARRVGLCLPNSHSVIDVFFATLMAGGCVCVFDPTWPLPLLRSLIQDHAPDLLVAPQQVLDAVSPSLPQSKGLPPEALDSLAAQTGDAPVLDAQPAPDMPFLLGFTSGSSGKPKGFIRSHQTWTESFRRSAVELNTKSDDVVMAPGPLSHGLSLYAVIEALSAGASAVIQTTFDADAVLKSVAATHCTTLVVVPTMLDVLRDQAGEQTFSRVQRVIIAGAKLLPSLQKNMARTFPNAETIEYYGASELSFISVAKSSEACPPDSVGRVFSGVDIALRDHDGGSVKTGQVGTIWVRSGMISSGYVGPVVGSGFRTDGDWATVGDFGHQDEDGFLYLDGREGSTITSAGYTVYPSAIETVLLNHPEVADAAVIGLPDPRWGEVIAAAVVLVKGSSAGEQALTEHCRGLLEPYACPRRWCFTDRLERTQSGKTRGTELSALFT